MSIRRPRLLVLDYGSGNLRSAQRALERVGADVEVSADPAAVATADAVVVPGVGAFAACMTALARVGATTALRDRMSAGRPVLGVCVGMQILFETGVEHGVTTAGLGRWPGIVDRLAAPVLPHMGWNTVDPAPDSLLFRGVGAERFYFVHSYAAREPVARTTWSEHGERFVAAVEDGPVTGTQFHPEKSGDVGAQLLTNWVATLR